MKKYVAIAIALLMICSVTVISVHASLNTYNSDVSLSISLNQKINPVSSSAQQVIMTVNTSKAVDLFSIGYTVVVPNGWKIDAIESGSSSILFKESEGHFSLKTGIVSWYSVSNCNSDAIAKITFTIPANTKAGSYSVGLQNVELATSDQNSDAPWMKQTSILATVVIGNSVPVTDCPKDSGCPISDYSDTLVDFWWHDGIHYCLENGLMNGVGKNASGKNCFDPNGITSRAMIVTILWRMEGKPSVNYNMTFKDVPAGTWYTEAIRWAASVGVVTGYDANKFGPDDNITREQLAAILYRYALNIKNKGTNVSLTQPLNFSDKNRISEYAVKSVHWCYAAGIVQGKGNNIFDPSGDATRAEAATMIYRFCNLIND